MIGVIEIVSGCWSVVISILIMASVATLYHKEKVEGYIRAYLVALGANIVLQVGDLMAWIYRGDMSEAGFYLVRISNFTFFIGMALLPAGMAWYVVQLIRNTYPDAGRITMHVMHMITCLMALVAVVNPFAKWLYYFDENNNYCRTEGWMLYVYHAMTYVAILGIHVFAWRHRKSKNCDSVKMVRLCCVLTEIAAVYQSRCYGISAFNIALTIGLLFIFVASIKEQSAELALKKEQLKLSTENLQDTRQKMLQLQIRPHFMFNCMTAIQTLVLEDQEQAYEAIGTLSTLLRTGIQFSQVSRLVSIEEELKFIECYVELQSIRFKDCLDVDMDIQKTGFVIPPLSIQPLVENAIDHGLKPYGHKGTICIRTYEEKTKDICYNVVEVEDNGVGVSPSVVEEIMNRPSEHLGMRNTRQRIEEGCNGIFEVISPTNEERRDGERPGTIVRMKLPQYNPGDIVR